MKKRLFRASEEKLNYEAMANKIYDLVGIKDIKKDTLDSIEKYDKNIQEDANEENNSYRIILHRLSSENSYDGQAIDIGRMFGVIKGGLVKEYSVEEIEDIWDDIYKISDYLESRFTDEANLDGKYEFMFDNDIYCLSYFKPHYNENKMVKELIEDVSVSYGDKYKRKEALPELIMDAYSAGNKEEAKKLEEEFNELKKIVSKRLVRLKKKGNNV